MFNPTDEIQCEDQPGEAEYDEMMEFVADCFEEQQKRDDWRQFWSEIRENSKENAF